MKVVKINISAVRAEDQVSGSITVQRKRGDAWLVENVLTAVSGQPSGEQVLVLDDQQRLIIEGISNTEVVMDRAQNAAVSRPIAPKPLVVDAEGTEVPSDTPSEKTAEGAIRGAGFAEAQAQERRDAAITEARRKLNEQQKPLFAPEAGSPLDVQQPPTPPSAPAQVVPPVVAPVTPASAPKPKVQL